MADLNTSYMGIPLKSPLVVAASSLSSMIERIQHAESAGAGALVVRSLFEEQVEAEQTAKIDELSDHLREARTYFPSLTHDSAREHLLWVKKARNAVKMPLIASLNATSMGVWLEYARAFEQIGVDGLELNIYRVEANPERTAQDIENELYEIVTAVVGAVKIPVSVKLSPFYTALGQVAKQLSQRGLAGLVLFNRFIQPDIDPETLSIRYEQHLSTSQELLLPLRWVALLYGRHPLDLALTTGVHSVEDVAKALLAGAQVVQIASLIYQEGFEALTRLNAGLARWMDERGFATLADYRGRLSQQHSPNPQALERAQYVKLLLKET
jgi:dihydroorotate dehydrogenase (fumarate)